MMPIIPLHQRILERLREQKKVDPYGLIGKGFMGDDDGLAAIGITPVEAVTPLLERGMVIEGDIIRFHIRITTFGEACLGFGLMPEAATGTAEEADLLGQLKALSSGSTGS